MQATKKEYTLEDKVNIILLLLNGDPDRDVKGIRPRLKDIEDKLVKVDVFIDNQERIQKIKNETDQVEKESEKKQWRYFAAGLTLAGALGSSGGTILFQVLKSAGIIP